MAQKLQTLKGFRDFLPRQMAIRNRVKKILIDVFESAGFEPISTPSLEYEEVLLGKYGPEADKLVYTFEDRGGRRVGMPYDLTVPTARVAASYANELPTPFKRYQIQRVWRAENTQRGRYREIEQCDIDILNSSSPLADAEIITAIYRLLSRLGLGEFQILLNSRPLLFGILSTAGIPEEKFNEASISIDKLDKLSEDEVKKELVETRGIPKDRVEKLFEIMSDLNSSYPTGEAFIESSEIKYGALGEYFLKLRDIAQNAVRLGTDPLALKPRFSLARGLDYYTGAIFESVVTAPKMGSITGGGRYDNLVERLGGPAWPAVGTTIGLDRICDIIEETGIWLDIPSSPTQILVTVFSEELLDNSIKLTKILRESGVNAEVYFEATKLEKQLKYADKKNIPWAVVLGPQEVADQTVVLKSLKTKTQETLLQNELAAKIR